METDGQKLHSVLTKTELCEMITKVIDKISDVFAVSKSEATFILIRLGWNLFQVSDRLSDNKEKILGEISEFCFTAANDENYVINSFMESESIKWCPAPDCGYAIKHDENVDDDDEEANYLGLVCLCGHIFCWRCQRESHHPVTCKIASIWCDHVLNQSRSVAWVAQNAKRCPNCSTAFQREEYSVFRLITCVCRFTFCWNCLRSEEEHQGNWNCTQVFAQPPRNQERADSSNFHFGLWEASDEALEKAKADLKGIEKISIPELTKDFCLSDQDIKALREAWMVIVQCRQVLKWSCVFGYFLPEYQSTRINYLKCRRESVSEALDKNRESILKLTDEAISSRDFTCFDLKLSNITKEVGNTFHEFVKDLEAGLPEVKVEAAPIFHWQCDRCTFKNNCIDKECTMCCFPHPSSPNVAFGDNHNTASSSSASAPNMPNNP